MQAKLTEVGAAIEAARAIAEGEDAIGRFQMVCFEQVSFVVEHLKGCGTAILDVRSMDADQSQRAIDFVSGACEALHDPSKGHIFQSAQLEDYVFVFGRPEDIAELQAPKVIQLADFRRLDR